MNPNYFQSAVTQIKSISNCPALTGSIEWAQQLKNGLEASANTNFQPIRQYIESGLVFEDLFDAENEGLLQSAIDFLSTKEITFFCCSLS